MTHQKKISGFSKLSKRGKIKWLVENFFKDPSAVKRELISYWHSNEDQQKILDGFSENTISNFPMPYGVAPNFVIDDKTYCVPMVIEESSVVAAAASAAKYWMSRGGFRTQIMGTSKVGQVHFKWSGGLEVLKANFDSIERDLRESVVDLVSNMEKRGGGVREIALIDLTNEKADLYQLKVNFETCDSMGANFINSVLERFAGELVGHPTLANQGDIEVIMSILSNYTPDCLVRAEVTCPIEGLGSFPDDMSTSQFAKKFEDALAIAHVDPYRAATHNKGIFNGIDSVVLATGNDFRAVEACGHSYASRNGRYTSLSHCEIKDGTFRFWLDIPLALGTVGGLTKLHPMARRSLELLENPSAEELMSIVAAVGLAQNFAAVRSLVTTGIQLGHMKMHLKNILVHFEADKGENKAAHEYFEDKVISFKDVRMFLDLRRKSHVEN